MSEHDRLTRLGASWLRKKQGCRVILVDPKTAAVEEIPDLLGYKYNQSILIEVKTSVSDFKKDADKPFRKPGRGMGQVRYYLTPQGLVSVKDIPAGWGLLEVDKADKVKVTLEAKRGSRNDPEVSARELTLLVTEIHRVLRGEVHRFFSLSCDEILRTDLSSLIERKKTPWVKIAAVVDKAKREGDGREGTEKTDLCLAVVIKVEKGELSDQEGKREIGVILKSPVSEKSYYRSLIRIATKYIQWGGNGRGIRTALSSLNLLRPTPIQQGMTLALKGAKSAPDFALAEMKRLLEEAKKASGGYAPPLLNTSVQKPAATRRPPT